MLRLLILAAFLTTCGNKNRVWTIDDIRELCSKAMMGMCHGGSKSRDGTISATCTGGEVKVLPVGDSMCPNGCIYEKSRGHETWRPL